MSKCVLVKNCANSYNQDQDEDVWQKVPTVSEHNAIVDQEMFARKSLCNNFCVNRFGGS